MTKNLGDTFSIVRHGDSRLTDIREPGIRTHPIRRDDGGVSDLSAGGTRRGQSSQHRSTILLNLALAPLIWEAVTRINLFRRWQQEEAATSRDIHPELKLDVFRHKKPGVEDGGAEQAVLAQLDGGSAVGGEQSSSEEEPGETTGEDGNEAQPAPRVSSSGKSQAVQNDPTFSPLTTNTVDPADFPSGSDVVVADFTSNQDSKGGVAGSIFSPPPPNTTPDVQHDKTAEALAGKTLIIAAADLLQNDSDADGDPLKIVGVSKASNGVAALNANGDVEFTPHAGFNGTATFSYTVSDGTDAAEGLVEVPVEVEFVTATGNWWAERLDLSAAGRSQYADTGRGNDTLIGSGYRDKLQAGEGDDVQYGYGGNDDFLIGNGHGFDRFDGGSGYDTIKAISDGTVIGLKGNFENAVEEITADGHTDVSILGTWQHQILDFSNVHLDGIKAIDGALGNDTIIGSQERDVLIGGKGDDTLSGEGGDDDFVVGLDHGFDTFDGGEGHDRVLASADHVNIGLRGDFDNGVEEFSSDGHQNVNIVGNWQAQSFDFSDAVLDGISSIRLEGGHDTAVGSDGDDTILGGTGNDVLTGALGADTFVYRSGDGHDTITDFGLGDDLIHLDGVSGFSSFSDVQGAFRQQGSDALLDLGPGQSILFESVLTSAFAEDQFSFA